MTEQRKAKISLIKEYSFDTNAMHEGKWFPLAGGEVRIARDGNPRHLSAIQDIAGKYPPSHILSVNEQKEIRRISAAKAIVMDWRGFEEEYSPNLCEQLMLEHPDFLDDVMKIAVTRANYRRAEVEAAAPN